MGKHYPDSISERMLSFSPYLHCALDQEGLFVKVSSACKPMLGYEFFELEGKSFKDFVFPEDKQSTLQFLQQIRKGNFASEFINRFCHKEGLVTSLAWTASWSEEDSVFLCIARETNCSSCSAIERRQTEQSETYLGETFQKTVIGITEVNHTLQGGFNFTKKHKVNLSTLSFLPEELNLVRKPSNLQDFTGYTSNLETGTDTKAKEPFVSDKLKSSFTNHPKTNGAPTREQDVFSILQANDELEQQVQKLSGILESITDAFFAVNKDWEFTYVNSVYAKHENCRKEDLIGTKIWDRFPQTSSLKFYDCCQKSVKTGAPVFFEENFPDSAATYRFKISPFAAGFSVNFTDITEEKKMQQEMEKLSLVASNTDNGVIIMDAQWRTEWVNEGFTKITGYTLSELTGKNPSAVLNGPETNKETVKEIHRNLRQGSTVNAELINYHKTAGKFWASIDISPIVGEDNKITRYVAIQRDITHGKDAEAQLVKMAEDLYVKNRDLQQFTYIVSHNLRAPVANALGLSHLLSRTDKSSTTFDAFLANLKTSLIRVDTVLKDMNLILSVRGRQAVLEKEQVPVVGVFRQALSHLLEAQHSFGVDVCVSIQKDVTVSASIGHLYSIFYNLLTNAIKFRSLERTPKVELTSFTDEKGRMVISFSDNGVGFDTEKAGRDVFKLYTNFHKHGDGRGFGLFLVKNQVEALGGEIEVISKINVGTKFLIYLPQS